MDFKLKVMNSHEHRIIIFVVVRGSGWIIAPNVRKFNRDEKHVGQWFI